MSFLEPQWLVLLAGVAALAAVYLVLQARRRHYAVRFTNLDLLSTIAPRRPGWRRHLPAAAVALGLAALVVSLARPVHEAQVAKEEATVMLVLDVSKSMDATDVAPTRIAAAADAAGEFVDGLPEGFEIGLVVFDSTARVLATPTTDHATVLDALEHVETRPATAAGEGLHAALEAIEVAQDTGDEAAAGDGAGEADADDEGEDEAPSASIVLLSDGFTTVGIPLEEATAEAVEQGVPVSTITYGTPDGTLEVEGEVVAVPPDTASMEEVAAETGGTAFTATSGDELRAVYEDIQARVGYDTEEQDVSRLFLAAGLFSVVVAAGAALVWTGRFL